MKRISLPIFTFLLVVFSVLHTVKAQGLEPSTASITDIAPDVLYKMGMEFGYEGKDEEALRYYKASAKKMFPPAFLAIGHVMRSEPHNNKTVAIKWYKRYVETKYEGWGYAAALVSKLYQEEGAVQKASEWANICKQSSYEGCPQ